MIQYLAAAGTNAGLTASCNQDSFGAKVFSSRNGMMTAAIMCDGMGGYSSGDVASATVVDAFQRWLLRRLPVIAEQEPDPRTVFEEWTGLIELCNQKIRSFGEQNGVRIGTTAVLLLATQERYMILNVGDCRVYLIDNDVQQLTRDQTLVERELQAGLLTAEQAKTDPRSHVLAECVGITQDVHPDYYTGAVKPESVFLLCCDGFRHKIGESEMLQYFAPERMRSCDAMQQQIRQLIDLNMQQGESDNISAITILAERKASQTIDLNAPLRVMQEFCYTDSRQLAV